MNLYGATGDYVTLRIKSLVSAQLYGLIRI